MSELIPSLVQLNKGLDLQTPKITAEAGTVLDSLNYEQVDFQGQKRIDGFVRYDGSITSDFNDWYILTVAEDKRFDVLDFLDLWSLELDKGELLLFNSTDVPVGKVINYYVTDSELLVQFVSLGSKVLPTTDQALKMAWGLTEIDTSYSAVELTASSVIKGSEFLADSPAPDPATTHYSELLDAHKTVRKNTTKLPGPISGLHWFVDRLYAVSDLLTITIDKGDFDGIIRPNDILILADADTYSGSIGLVVVGEVDEESSMATVVVGTSSENWLDCLDQTVLGIDRSTGEEYEVGIVVSVSYGTVSSLFESRAEQQVIEEDPEPLVQELYDVDEYIYGWRFKHLGWKIPYEEGSSLYGTLPALNQNIEGLGVQGPTDTTGNNGRPALLTQNVAIEGKPVQVQGWKGSTTPESFDLDVNNITSIDDEFIYADAYISWDGESGDVSSPGLTTSNLEARSADAHVEITL